MQTYRNLFPQLCSFENLRLAFQKARKRKTQKEYVQRFEKNLANELYALQWELLTGIYRPGPLKTFTVRDPKTRKISASHFRDRVVHHAICNVIEPIFEPRFIHDTFANRTGKGTSGILQRADCFIRKVGNGYALKADIRHYFDTVDHEVLISILGKRVKDQQLMQLIKVVLGNHRTENQGKGMPLGNLTSQFFANVYLGELDHFVKHELRARHYVRYVDDFVIFSRSRAELESWKKRIDTYLAYRLRLTLHPDKTKIMPIRAGVQMVGFRLFQHHKILKKSNLRRLRGRLATFREMIRAGTLTQADVRQSMTGWEGYAKMGDTFTLRQEVRKEIAEMGVPA
jgi:retron-type reverse transcriptase